MKRTHFVIIGLIFSHVFYASAADPIACRGNGHMAIVNEDRTEADIYRLGVRDDEYITNLSCTLEFTSNYAKKRLYRLIMCHKRGKNDLPYRFVIHQGRGQLNTTKAMNNLNVSLDCDLEPIYYPE